ncbi:MAG TPA: hypothetical protein VHL58_08185 [Thermoanaerobaculia bacterium]|nr:hypothetical protein [Thermoanaerobaculia bacterium]
MIRRLWLASSFLLLLPAVFFWTRLPLDDVARLPLTPFDGVTTSVETDEWDFIVRAHAVVPPGKTFTVRASTPQLALEVYMMSLGVLPEDEGFPSSYFGAPDAGTKAEYVLDYRCGGKPDSAMQRLAAFPSGCVDRRGSQ